MAIASSIIAAGLAAAAIAGSTAISMKQSHDQKKAVKAQQQQLAKASTYDAKAEKNNAANMEAEANKRRVLAETDTIKTSALGNTGTTETKKKTLLGG